MTSVVFEKKYQFPSNQIFTTLKNSQKVQEGRGSTSQNVKKKKCQNYHLV
jgi:hypothetical protein